MEMSEWTDHLSPDVSPNISQDCKLSQDCSTENFTDADIFSPVNNNIEENDLGLSYSSKCYYCHADGIPVNEFVKHHIQHIRQPTVSLHRIDILNKVKHHQVNKGSVKSYFEEKSSAISIKRSPIRLLFKRRKRVEAADDSKYSLQDIFQVCKNPSKSVTDTMSSEVSTPVPDSVQPPPALSPTPSEILKPEGFMPPSPVGGENGIDEKEDEVATPSESPTSEMEHDAEDENDISGDDGRKSRSSEKDDESSTSDKIKQDDKSGDDAGQQDADSGVESERDGFPGFEMSENSRSQAPATPTPTLPKVGSLTILAPSSLNSSVLNGTLSITPSDSSSTDNSNSSEPFSVLGGLSIEPVTVPSSGSITLTPAHNGGNIESGDGGDPLNMLQGFIDQPSGDNMEYMPLDQLATAAGRSTCEVCGEHAPDPIAMENHKNNAGHFKCHASSDCAVAIFCSKAEFTSHQLNTHGIQPRPPPPAPMEQLTQQVQRLPVPYSPASSQSGQSPSSSQAQIYRVPVSGSPQPGQSPQQGTIQPRAFANMSQARVPLDIINNSGQSSGPRSSPDGSLSPGRAGKRPSPSIPAGPAGTPNGKQRRMDILLPDRHDDADCHVIAMQKRSDSGLQIQNVQGRDTNGFQLSDSISLTATTSRTPPAQQIGQKKGNDANAVANILATRGITVTPAGGNRSQQPPPQPPPQQQVSAGRSLPAPVTTLNLNSAISIIPTNQGRQNSQPGFAVPQGRIRNQPQAMVERPPRCPTVDLTQDTPTTHRGRPPGRLNRHTCQVCDKIFATSDALATHMLSHRSPGKLPYRCNLCNAQYPTQQGLTQHKQTFHKENAGSEMALPVVDLKQPGLTSRLASLGIRHFIPLSQLQSQTGGVFGLPIVAIDNARNPAVCNLGALGASNVLSLGPMKAIGPR